MTIKELRKSGKLQEALQAAEAEFAKSVNKYTVGALYWCLNDLYKQQSEDDARHTVEKMKELCDEYGAGDDMMQNTLTYAQRNTNPYKKEIQNSIAKAKDGGDVSESYARILQAYNSNSLDRSLYLNFGWLIYYVLKNTPNDDVKHRKLLLHQYLKLDLPRPELLHSCILSEAVKVEQNTPLQFRIRDFFHLWGPENLREDDWVQFKNASGYVRNSLVEKLVRVYSKEIKTDRIVAPKEFEELLDKALQRYPNNQYIPEYKAIVLLSQGNKEEAIKYYKNLILQFQSKFYLWSQLAELVDDVDTKIGLLCKAISVGVEEKFLGSVRLQLARLLVSKGLLPNAQYELNKYKELYTVQRWNLKSEYLQLASQLGNISAVDNTQSIYSEFSSKADSYIYSGLPSLPAIKVSDKLMDDKNRPGKKFVQWILRTSEGILRLKKPAKYGLGKFANGAVFEVKTYNGKTVWIKPSQADILQHDWVKTVEGNVRLRTDRKGKTYAILDGVFIEEKLLNTIKEGDTVKIIAIAQEAGRWSAVSLVKI